MNVTLTECLLSLGKLATLTEWLRPALLALSGACCCCCCCWVGGGPNMPLA